MFQNKIRKINQLAAVGFAILFSLTAYAQQVLPNSAESERLSDAIAQTNGEYDSVNLNYLHSLGMQQKAWNDPLAHMGEGQSKPGYSKYTWSPDVILPLRLREGTMTLINLPTWELIEKVHIGSPESFGGEIAAPNSLLIYADPSYIGVDSNMIIFGRSGNRYVFYLRSETYNTEKITQFVVDILVGPKYTPVEAGGRLGATNGVSNPAVNSVPRSGTISGWGYGRSGGQNPQIGGNTPQNWLQNIPVDPESIHFDIDMYIPNPADVDIAPDNVWRDNIFTYIDLGPKSLTMTQRPIVNLIVQDTEVPVGFRTSGPNSRLIVVEAIGDLVLRNGKKIICLKLRRDPSSGLEYTDYSGSEMMGASSGTIMPSVMSEEAPASSLHNEAVAEAPVAMPTNTASVATPVGMPIMGYAVPQQIVLPQSTAIALPADQMGGFYAQNMAPIQSIPANVMSSAQASSGIVDVMNQMPMNAQPVNPLADSETISVELATHPDIGELEGVWDKIYAKNTDVLKGYEPYYSVDTTADGNVRELFRLRIGPMKDISTADNICSRLGRRGFSCSVVRVQ